MDATKPSRSERSSTWHTLLDAVVAKVSHFGERLDKKKKEERNLCSNAVKFVVFYFTYLCSLPFHLPSRKCQKILGKNTELWEFEVYKFKEIGQLKVS